MIKVIVSQQVLYHRRKTGVTYAYPISTASEGVGNQEGSYQTPLGKHKIYAKIGADCAPHTFFISREPKGIFTQKMKIERADWILSRIIWLEGVQVGVNKHGKVDTKKRYIYIHGTDEEDKIGAPASHGCIRMKNIDIIELFTHVSSNEKVTIAM